MKNVIVSMLLIIVVFAVSSCAGNSTKDAEKMPGIDIPISEMNSKIRLEPYPGMPSVHKSGSSLTFVIRNHSSNAISFEPDFGINIFQQQGTTWEPVENKWSYPEENNILLTSKKNPIGLFMFAYPGMDDVKEVTTVRIVIIGHIVDRPDEQVGAYYDVKYEP